jgi:hypothetical protein
MIRRKPLIALTHNTTGKGAICHEKEKTIRNHPGGL